MQDIMIDLETMGTHSDAAIVSLGAVEFDFKTGGIGHTLYRVIDLADSFRYARTIDAGTVYWWLEQNDMARQAIVQEHNRESCLDVADALEYFIFRCGNPKKIRLWGNGPTFDNSMIRSFYRNVKGEFPIPFWMDRCVRTVVGFYPSSLFKEWKLSNPRRGTYHNALDDAKYQVKYLCHILKELGVDRLY